MLDYEVELGKVWDHTGDMVQSIFEFGACQMSESFLRPIRGQKEARFKKEITVAEIKENRGLAYQPLFLQLRSKS